jgi:hypothetical protein
LDGRLKVLSSRDGNGLCVKNIPAGVTNAGEGGSARPNESEEEFRIPPKGQARSTDLATVVLEREQSLWAS